MCRTKIQKHTLNSCINCKHLCLQLCPNSNWGLFKLKWYRQRTLISLIQGGYKRLKLCGPYNYYSSKSVTVAAGVRLVVVNITAVANPADWDRIRVAHKNNCLRIPQGCVTFRRWGPVVPLTKLCCRCYVTFPKSMAGCTGLREELVVQGVDCWSRWLTHGKVRRLTNQMKITIILLSRQLPSTRILLHPPPPSSRLTESSYLITSLIRTW